MEQAHDPQSALAVIDEMIVQLRDHPGHELAIAIATRGKILRDLGRLGEAAESFHKAIEVTLPLSESDPGAFEVMLDRFVHDYRETCDEAPLAPDMALLTAAEPFLPIR
jgi:hypothetical protein